MPREVARHRKLLQAEIFQQGFQHVGSGGFITAGFACFGFINGIEHAIYVGLLPGSVNFEADAMITFASPIQIQKHPVRGNA